MRRIVVTLALVASIFAAMPAAGALEPYPTPCRAAASDEHQQYWLAHGWTRYSATMWYWTASYPLVVGRNPTGRVCFVG